ncbi:restriction endonuclease subunit M [endosymbiont GvMRE of Glomus versiforme]|uniref:restriction endonuclease subunit M n=1 Tax=endosymbiont GvMRE of Glomus versiforme TaxID=2039283 RepID=UPI000EE5EC9B|nr:N-6 DNA methylase [endosymbiont GvMRE of Glomus versiforme]RHZ36630.1 N-6 DNA methylase [endosymbiont GvMRE of Glomus versiforme]RHZ36913.1 N-6 DNA methylase [endosymbiont GvMRE of Glomus versiforme]
MNIELTRNLKKYLDNSQQREKAVVIYDFERKKVKYSEKIQSHREIDKFGGEEMVRAYILAKLVNELGYKLENIEIEKKYHVGTPKTAKPRIDIIVKRDNGDVFLYMELKSPEEYGKDKEETIKNQLFSLASQEKGQGKKVKYLVLYSIETIEDTIKDECILIDYEKFASFDSWKETRSFANKLPKAYGEAQKEPYVKGGEKDLEKRIIPSQLNEVRKNLHNVLWGGGGTDDNDIFSSLVNIILAKIQDEGERESGEPYEFQTFSFKSDNSRERERERERERDENNEQLFERINNLYKRALKQRLNITDQKKLKKSFVVDENKFSLAKLKYAVSELERFSFFSWRKNSEGKDILGDFFEEIVRERFKQTKGQFFTHTNIVKFLLWGLQLDKLAIKKVNDKQQLPYLIDPAAGSGTFLIEYMKFITKNLKVKFKDKLSDAEDIKNKHSEWFPDNKENKWAKEFIYGIEINFNLGTATKVNMILHGDGSANIFVKDGLLPFSYYGKEEANLLKRHKQEKTYFNKEINGSFDVVVSNPPFSISLSNETKEHLKEEFIFGNKKNSENLFIERWYQLLKPNGRLGVVLPESVFDTAENKHIRLFIYKYFDIKAIISLPQLTFQPFTSTKTSLLFAQKKSKEKIQEWDKFWSKYSKEWSDLKTKCENLLMVYIHGKNKKQFSSIRELNPIKEKNILVRMLKDCIEEDDKKLSVGEFIKKYQKELVELNKYDNDTKDTFGFVNTWWVFSEVAKKVNYQMFLAEVENIGYKRTKRGEKTTSNELFRTNNQGEILLADEDGIMETALDHLRKLEWGNF